VKTHQFELPSDREAVFTKAVRLEWITIAFLITAIVAIYLTLGSSQAMKTAWVEDILSLIPPAVFLIASRFRNRPPTPEHPYGFHRGVSIAYLCASLALFVMGAILLLDSVMKLVTAEHPSIGTVVLFGHQIWLGWLMIAALAYSVVPAVLLGRMKLPVARQLHDKVLFADAEMNKADWLTAVAAIAGILGIGIGLWWADAAAAAFISFEILRDGYSNVRQVVSDLMDSRPRSVDHQAVDPLPARVETEMRKLGWVRDVRARLREEGHVYFGEVYVVPADDTNLVDRIEKARERLESLDWRLHDLVIVPTWEIETLEEEPK
jgi:cation diffusion facilitator family transporter